MDHRESRDEKPFGRTRVRGVEGGIWHLCLSPFFPFPLAHGIRWKAVLDGSSRRRVEEESPGHRAQRVSALSGTCSLREECDVSAILTLSVTSTWHLRAWK